jgi:hypothetical protein
MLSFIVVQNDPGNISQINLIDAAVGAGVKRFAPSEWGGYAYVLKYLVWDRSCLLLNICRSSDEGMPWAGKAKVREYLRQINHPKKVGELFIFA